MIEQAFGIHNARFKQPQSTRNTALKGQRDAKTSLDPQIANHCAGRIGKMLLCRATGRGGGKLRGPLPRSYRWTPPASYDTMSPVPFGDQTNLTGGGPKMPFGGSLARLPPSKPRDSSPPPSCPQHALCGETVQGDLRTAPVGTLRSLDIFDHPRKQRNQQKAPR